MIFNEASSVKEVNCVRFDTDWIGFSKKWRTWLPGNRK